MEKSEKNKDSMILELIRLVDSEYKMRQLYRVANPYFIILIILIITLAAGSIYSEVYLGEPRDVSADLTIMISIIVLIIAFLAAFEKEEERGLVNGNFKKLKRNQIVNEKNEPLLKSLIIMKTKQPETSLEQIYSLNEEAFTLDKLVERLYK